jgi:hypothetical protein
VFVLCGLYYLTVVWSARNATVENLWSVVLSNGLLGVIILGVLLVLRAVAIQLATGGFRASAERAATGPFYDDPGRMLRLAIHAVAYVGLLSLIVNMIGARDGVSAAGVWYFFFNRLMPLVVATAILLGFRALYREVVQPGQAALPNGRTAVAPEGATPQTAAIEAPKPRRRRKPAAEKPVETVPPSQNGGSGQT